MIRFRKVRDQCYDFKNIMIISCGIVSRRLELWVLRSNPVGVKKSFFDLPKDFSGIPMTQSAEEQRRPCCK
jgi:hypothetical protein